MNIRKLLQCERRIYLSVACLAAAALMLESTLTRLLAVAQYYHFAFLVVSLALLGFGASGSLLSIFPDWYESEDDRAGKMGKLMVIFGSGFTASIALCYGVVNWLPFDSYSIAWDTRQVFYFGLYYLVLTIPFLFAGLGIGAALSSSPGKSNQVYAVNLLGSAAGILLALIVLQLAGVPGALLACGITGLIAVLAPNWVIPKIGRLMVWGMVTLGIITLFALSVVNSRFHSSIGVTVSPYKGLPYALRIPNADQLFGSWNAISRLDVVAGASTRVMPGLSYTYPGNPPPQLGLAIDADALQPITLVDPDEFTGADYLPEAISFRLRPNAEVLVLESGAGLGVLQSLAGGARQVTAVVKNPLVLEAISETAPRHDVYSDQRVDVEVESSRVILGSETGPYDVIYLPLNDPYRPVASGAYSLSENFTLTVESFADMISQLSTDGILVATRWIQTPPSEALRIFATTIEALERLGIDNPEEKIVAYRGIQTMTFLVKRDDWKDGHLGQVREFAKELRYDIVWAPGITSEEVNRYNKLEKPLYFQVFRDLVTAQSRPEFYFAYPYSIRPATDDSPFFFHFFKWEQTPEILATFGRVWQPFGGSGYFVLLALLILVAFLSLLLIILPLIIQQRQSQRSVEAITSQQVSSWRILVYFGSIGIAFLFLEIPLIQKSILSMEHPAYAFTLIVLVLLTFSSIGSYFARKLWYVRRWVLLILFGLSIISPIWVSLIQENTLGWSLILRGLVLGLSLAPMGIMMGVPFPLGLTWLERAGSPLVPWAWAVNGCASVVAAVLAAMLVLSTSFSIVLIFGAIFYGVAALVIKA